MPLDAPPPATRPHPPPRLQHSPSLPNIWFPPHSGPIPPQLVQHISRDNLHLPSPLAMKMENKKLEASKPSAEFSATSSRKRPRHNPLLTPPTTPASSIRTTASIESDQSPFQDITDSTRFLLVSNVSRTVGYDQLNSAINESLSTANLKPHLPSLPGLSSSVIRNATNESSPIKGVFVRCQQNIGVVILAFFDVRYAFAAKAFLSTRSTGALDACVDKETSATDTWLSCKFMTPEAIIKMVGPSPFLKSSVADFFVAVEHAPEQEINLTMLRSMLQSYGGIRSFGRSNEPPEDEHSTSSVFHVEFYDIRDSDVAFTSLDHQVIFGMKIKVFGIDGPEPEVSPSEEAPIIKLAGRSPHRERFVFPDETGKSSMMSEETQNHTEASTSASPTYFYTSTPSEAPRPPHEGAIVNGMRQLTVDPSSEPVTPNHLYPPEIYYYTTRDERGTVVGQASYYPPYPQISSPSPYQVPYPVSPTSPYEWPAYDHSMMRPFPGPSFPPGSPGEFWCSNMALMGSQNGFYPQAHHPMGPGSPIIVPTTPRFTPPTQAPVAQPSSTIREPAPPSERNQLRIDKIEDGLDTRTTVMIKNIPNKMSDKDLIAFIGKVCPRKIDFLYLRMDFQNGCNVGYAFVNFIDVQDLLWFAKKRLGQKWNMFSSEKVLQMSYANYQGKEALVEKFKNSCIMDEREAWQPKIFYSEPGPEQGLPEPFPAPTHLRRKERSSHNRGTLYVPGTSLGVLHNSQAIRRRHDVEDRPRQQRHRIEDEPAFNGNGSMFPDKKARPSK